MANTFALILTAITFFCGIFWFLDYFKFAPARRRQAAELLNNNKQDSVNLIKPPMWLELPVSLFPVILVVFIIRSFIYEPFQIPSGSMMPTLLIGDFILVEKYAYGIKEPISQKTLIETGHPQRGDIAVFKYPLDPSIDYIKRVIGLPGDTLRYNNITKELSIKPACQLNDCPDFEPLRYTPLVASQWSHGWNNSTKVSRFYNTKEANYLHASRFLDLINLQTREEKLGNTVHQILIIPYRDTRSTLPAIQEWVVPKGHYFMMGDNRDFSADSRFWGFVPERNLVGKATIIWLSFEKQENEWPTRIRFSRIGRIH